MRGARVLAFEPAPPLFEILAANTLWCRGEVLLFDCGLGDREGAAELTFYPATSGMSTFHADPGEERPKVRTSLLQLPHQGSASGGPVVNAAGKLVGILAAREAARQDLAYAATPAEIRVFLESVRPLSAPRTADEWVHRGRLAQRCRRQDAALEAFRQAIRLTPDDAAAVAGLAASVAAAGHRDEAIRLAESALAMRPDAATLAELANVLLDQGERDRAAAMIDAALKQDARCAAALAARSRLKTGKEAEADLADALFIDPNLAAAHRALARLRDQSTLEGRRQAIADWGRVLELDPVDADALRSRAELLVRVKEAKKAVADWARVCELEPLVADNWIGLARARFTAGHRSGAAEVLRSALRVDGRATGRVFEIVRDCGRELEADNLADRERVALWYSTALNQLAGWLPD